MSNSERIRTHGITHRTTAHHGFCPRLSGHAGPLVLGALLLLGAARAEAAFGVSPPSVEHDAVLVGTTLVQTVNYSTDTPDDGYSFSYTEQSCDAELASWMTVSLTTGLELKPGELAPWPAGDQRLPTIVSIAVPPNAALGERRCILMTKRCSSGVDGGGVSICLGAAVLVDIFLTDQPLVAYRTMNVAASPNRIELGSPLRLAFEVENTGNVDVTSLQMEARVWSRKLGSPYPGPYSAQGTNNALAPPVPAYRSSPREKREKIFPFTSLPVGEYYLGVTTYNQNGVDYNNDILYLQVYAPDAGVRDAAGDAAVVDAKRDAAFIIDGGRVPGDVGAMDTARSDTPLGPGFADARLDAPDSAPSDLARADRATGSSPEAAIADAPTGVVQVDATAVPPVDAVAPANAVDAAIASVTTLDAGASFPNGSTPEVGGASVDAGHGSATSGNGCSCRLGKGGGRSSTTWLVLVGLFALSRLGLRRKKPRS